MNYLPAFFLLLLSSFVYHSAQSMNSSPNNTDTSIACDTFLVSDTVSVQFSINNCELLSPLVYIKITKNKSKKIIAAVLAFPLPFGILGLHRIFLGTKPYIPFVYIGTIGGCLFILPILDFIALLSADEETFKRFENNPRVFMWSH